MVCRKCSYMRFVYEKFHCWSACTNKTRLKRTAIHILSHTFLILYIYSYILFGTTLDNPRSFPFSLSPSRFLSRCCTYNRKNRYAAWKPSRIFIVTRLVSSISSRSLIARKAHSSEITDNECTRRYHVDVEIRVTGSHRKLFVFDTATWAGRVTPHRSAVTLWWMQGAVTSGEVAERTHTRARFSLSYNVQLKFMPQ